MIHELLTLARPLLVFDTETTGANPQVARIVEIGFKLYTSEGLQKEWRSLVNPECPIPPAVVKVHGIDNARMLRCRVCDKWPGDTPTADGEPENNCTCDVFKPVPTFKVLAASLAKGFSGCDFAGKNVRFDLQVLDAEMKRANMPWSYDGAAIIDSGRLEQIAEPRTLSDLYRKYLGKEMEGAHGALSDVSATIEVLAAQLRVHAGLFPRTVGDLHKLQWPDWIDVEGKFKFQDGVAVCAFGKHRGDAMNVIPRGFYDWILRNDFNADVKALARNAKLGVYPTPTALPGEDDVI